MKSLLFVISLLLSWTTQAQTTRDPLFTSFVKAALAQHAEQRPKVAA